MSQELKPCPACHTKPHMYFNDVVWRVECRNRACPSAEATTGISGISRHTVVNNWNCVVVPSVENEQKETYENSTNDRLQ